MEILGFLQQQAAKLNRTNNWRNSIVVCASSNSGFLEDRLKKTYQTERKSERALESEVDAPAKPEFLLEAVDSLTDRSISVLPLWCSPML